MSKNEKAGLYLFIINVAYFVSTDIEWLKTASWLGMMAFGLVFVLAEGK